MLGWHRLGEAKLIAKKFSCKYFMCRSGLIIKRRGASLDSVCVCMCVSEVDENYASSEETSSS